MQIFTKFNIKITFYSLSYYQSPKSLSPSSSITSNSISLPATIMFPMSSRKIDSAHYISESVHQLQTV